MFHFSKTVDNKNADQCLKECGSESYFHSRRNFIRVHLFRGNIRCYYERNSSLFSKIRIIIENYYSINTISKFSLKYRIIQHQILQRYLHSISIFHVLRNQLRFVQFQTPSFCHFQCSFYNLRKY